MDYYERIGRAVDFIEDRLDEPLTLRETAERACFSLFHFYRVFQAIGGCTVKEYVRGRRLYSAAADLRGTDDRVLDIALKYQYETHASFTRAFKKHFGFSPQQYRKQQHELEPFPRMNVIELKHKHLMGDYKMEPKFIEKEAFKVIGVALNTTIIENENSQSIPKFWGSFNQSGRAEEIPNRVYPDTMLGMCADNKADGAFTYLICSEVKSLDQVPEGMVARTIAGGRYAVFTSRGKIPDSIQTAWQYIFNTWLPQSGFDHSGTEDFELYDGRCANLEDAEVDIYIPIK
jgi:AraC family transcriptional regulator